MAQISRAPGALSTPIGRGWKPGPDRRIYILWMALVWAGMLAGFLPDLGRFQAEAPPPPFLLNLHGVIFTVWLVMVSAQIALAETGQPALHKQLGWWTAGVAVLLVPLGVAASMVDMVRETAPTHHDPLSLSPQPQFLGLELQSMLVFPLLLTLAIRMRRDLSAHKRLMMLLLVSVLDPGTARAFANFVPWHPAGMAGWWLSYFWGNAAFVALMMAWDRWKHGRVHPALWVGAAILALGEATAVYLEFAPWWHDVSAALTKAWGRAG